MMYSACASKVIPGTSHRFFIPSRLKAGIGASSEGSSFHSSVSASFLSTSAPPHSGLDSHMQSLLNHEPHDDDCRSCTTPPRVPDLMSSSVLATDSTGSLTLFVLEFSLRRLVAAAAAAAELPALKSV